MSKYDHAKIEAKWQKKWLEEKTYEPDLDAATKSASGKKKPFYNLMMFPYPSAEGLHVGNMYAFTGSDIYGRYERMNGFDVFEPIGLDGFGIHSENYAMKIGAHPIDQAQKSEKRFYEQLQKIGNGFAWDEHLETYDPEYYRWTQWIFVQMWKHGLAYRKKQSVNWCPKDLTVLADEQVENGKCERCGTVVLKRDLEQWSFRITNYADRLLKNLETLDWSEKVKVAQKNWIGKSEGAEISFLLDFKKNPTDNDRRGPNGERAAIKVFTTRPDTLFGATYLVLSPEHPWVTLATDESHDVLLNKDEVKAYAAATKKSSEAERLMDGKEKTGVELKGVKAINPANNEEIPMFIADYVLGSYGTGAIMAVPAHDERDFAFAKKFNLPVKEVIVPNIVDKRNPPLAGKKIVERNNIHAIIKDPKTGKYLALTWKKFPWTTFPMGGMEPGEDAETAARREVREETGFTNLKLIKVLDGRARAEYFAAHKDENRVSYTTAVVFELENDHREPIDAKEQESHEITWLDHSQLNYENMTHAEVGIWNEKIQFPEKRYTDGGVLVDSGKFSGMDSKMAKIEITKFVGGKMVTTFRLRDWLISRQRYWGPPIPMIFCEACAKAEKGENKDMPGWYAVPEDQLPVLLPSVKDFRPSGTGMSPLANVKEFYETTCPACGGAARRETDVSDTFLDSAWYYLRYLSPDNTTAAFDKKRVEKWLPVATYIGGAEHAVLHLLYVRFVAMALHDWGYLPFEEPIKKFRAHGLVIKDGAKMSKSKGNVINPDEYVKNFGADTLRTYLMFMAPFEDGGDFRDEAILGIERFLARIWKYGESGERRAERAEKKNVLLHKTIKKVGEDIASLHYNTGISAMMIYFRDIEDNGASTEEFEIFLKLLAPFAPHITEEIWRETLGHKTSIHRETWPEFDASIIKEDTITLVLQINSRTRDTVSVPADMSEADATALALANEKIKTALKGATPKKIIFVSGKLVNIVS